MILSVDDFLSRFRLQKDVSYEEFCSRLSILDFTDRSGNFAVKSGIDEFIERVASQKFSTKEPQQLEDFLLEGGNTPKWDERAENLESFKKIMYEILVRQAEQALRVWYRRFIAIEKPLSHYFRVPFSSQKDGVFDGRANTEYGRICKNINFDEFYNTKKLYTNDSQYCFGLIRAAFEEFKIRNSMVCPAFFEHTCRYSHNNINFNQFWSDFMFGANKPSVFNPSVYRTIADNLLEGEVLFAPVMGWNSYQLAFYETGFSHFVATDVIPSVVDNGQKIHKEYLRDFSREDLGVFDLFGAAQQNKNPKTTDLYLCPSECLESRGFLNRYQNNVDGILFSPPYFDLEIYRGEDQSTNRFPDYKDWLKGYWEQTILLCAASMRKGAKLAFVVSNYANQFSEVVPISQDLARITEKHLKLVGKHKLKWSVVGGTRQPHKTREGNFEDIWLFQKF